MATLLKRRRKKKYYQGIYEVVNKSKYLGTKDPRFLSSYELKVFRRFDLHPNIIEWGAEIVVVPYFNPLTEKKCRYIVDVLVKYENMNGEIKTDLIEIKPSSQIAAPVKTKGKSQESYNREYNTYIKNRAKWEAAEKYAKDRGWNFHIMSEKNIFI